MIRDEEINRLISYAKGLGIKVVYTSKDQGGSAFWYLDNSKIEICKSYNQTKIETILSLIHELGHAKHNIHENNREVDNKVEKALDHVDEAEENNEDAPKKQRKILLNDEIAGTKYWHDIYKETNMRFPIWRLEAAIEYDVWNYQIFHETGKDATQTQRKKKHREINNKHRK